MGLSNEYSRVVNYLIQSGGINPDREIDGDLYKTLNTKPYNFRNIIESLRIIFNLTTSGNEKKSYSAFRIY